MERDGAGLLGKMEKCLDLTLMAQKLLLPNPLHLEQICTMRFGKQKIQDVKELVEENIRNLIQK